MSVRGDRRGEAGPGRGRRAAGARWLRLAVACGCILLLFTTVHAAEPDRPLAAGERAPDFTLGDQHGKPFRLTEALARRDFVVLAFYVKAFTGG